MSDHRIGYKVAGTQCEFPQEGKKVVTARDPLLSGYNTIINFSQFSVSFSNTQGIREKKRSGYIILKNNLTAISYKYQQAESTESFHSN